MEFYDFVVYAFFAVYIGKAFFPSTTAGSSLLLSVIVFGVGFFARPLGGLVIGRFADRAGRKPAMMLTVALITVGTLALALTPTYASIGLAAPVIVVFARLVQGFALGGEVGPSTTFLVELAPAHRRGYYASWQLASQGLAVVLAGAVGLGLALLLTPADMQAWGWRIPFLLSLLLVPIALYLRQAMPETLDQKDSVAQTGANAPQKRWGLLVLAVFLVAGGTVATYVSTYMTTYAVTTLKLPASIGMAATIAVGISTVIFSLLGGWLSDKVGRKPVMFWPRAAIVVSVVPMFMYLVAYPSLMALIVVTTVLSALTAMSSATAFAAIPEMFPRQFRATGLSIAYAVGASVFGGTTQMVVTWLLGATGNALVPAWYVAGACAVTLLAVRLMPESGDKPLLD